VCFAKGRGKKREGKRGDRDRANKSKRVIRRKR
jgi:hypothetical protein